MKSTRLKGVKAIALTVFSLLVTQSQLAAQDNSDDHHHVKHHHYKLIVLGTLGGPQSYGDGGHGAANINGKGTAAGNADTDTPDPFYPNYNPLLTGGLIGSYPYVFHAFTSNGGALTDLGSLPGASSSTPTFITDNGLVAGQSLNGSIDPYTGWPQMNAVVWKNGQIINLGTLGGYESLSYGVNSRGQVVGGATNNVPDSYLAFGTQARPYLWNEQDGMRDLGTLGGPDGSASDINERDQIAGQSFTNFTINPTTGIPTQDPFLWQNGTMIDLGTLGGTIGSAGGINNRGQVFGNSNLPGDATMHGFLWDHGILMDIGSLGGAWSSANGMNDAGHIVGQATIASGDLHAFLWRHRVMSDLGPVPGFEDTTCIGAFGINARDQVVGQAVENFCSGPAAHAFLWEDGDMVDVNDLVPPGSDLTLVEIEHINNSGEMFGIGTLSNGNNRAFLLIPCDEDHRGIKDCDFSEVEESVSAIRIGSPPVEQRPTNANPWVSAAPSSILRLLGHRSMPWYRGLGVRWQLK